MKRDNRGRKPTNLSHKAEYERALRRNRYRYDNEKISHEDFIRNRAEILIRYHKRMEEGDKGNEREN